MSEKIELYQPCNGTEGDFFMSEYCFKCVKFPHDRDAKNQCMIVLETMAWNKEDPEYPNQWRYVDGSPTCIAFKDREEFNAERREKRKSKPKPVRCDKTLDLFLREPPKIAMISKS